MSQAPTVPAVHLHHLVQLVARWKVTPDQLLAGTGCDAASVAGNARVPLATVIVVAERARRLTDPAIGIHFGMAMRVSWHGFLGFAALASPTLRDAAEVAARFARTRTDALGIRLQVEGGRAALVLDELVPLGPAQDTIVLALMTGIWQIANQLVGKVIEGELELAFAEPPYFAKLQAFALDRVRFGQPGHRMVFDASILALPIVLADRDAQQLARTQLEAELAAVGGATDVVAQVRALLPDGDHGFRAVGDVARRAGMSVRTLKRRLADRGTSFTALLDEARREKATLLLRAGELTVDEIGQRLGYSDAANFGRAFRRWTGTTPKAFRDG